MSDQEEEKMADPDSKQSDDDNDDDNNYADTFDAFQDPFLRDAMDLNSETTAEIEAQGNY